jgi:hypothetical protein
LETSEDQKRGKKRKKSDSEEKQLSKVRTFCVLMFKKFFFEFSFISICIDNSLNTLLIERKKIKEKT